MSVRRVVVSVAFLAWGLVGSVAAAEPPDARARAEAILKRAEEASLRPFGPAFRSSALEALVALSPEELEAREAREPGTGLGLLALGDSSSQLVYTPVPPCRLLDTRLQGGQLTAGSIRDFRVTGGDLSGQGGSATGCNVLFGAATAAMINFVAVAPAGAGNLRAWAYATPPPAPPNASILNYAQVPGVALNLANGIVVPLCDPNATTCPNLDLRIRADSAATHVVADVVGYFERFPKQQARSFTVVDTSASNTIIAGSCTHVTGSEVQLTAPVAGRVVVRSAVVFDIRQDNGGDRVLVMGITTSPTDCGFTNYAHHKIMNATFTETFLHTMPVSAVFDVVPGSYTYYLNGYMPLDPNNATVHGVTFLEATFYPN